MAGGTGLRPPDLYDPETDPEYETALRAYLASVSGGSDVSALGKRTGQFLASAGTSLPQSSEDYRTNQFLDLAAKHGAVPPEPPDPLPEGEPSGGVPRPMAQPAAALRAMAPGASQPRRIVGPTLTLGPGGSVGTYDVTDPALTPEEEAAQGPTSVPPKPSLLDRAGNAAAEAFTSPGLLQAMRGEPRTERTPLQALSDKVDDFRNPLPDVSMPLPGEAPPAETPALPPPPKKKTVQVRQAAHVDVPNEATAESLDRGPGGAPAADPSHAALMAVAQRARQEQGDVDLEAALQAAAGRRLVAGLARAGGSMIGRGQGAAYDALDREAEAPVQEYGMRRAVADQDRQRAALEAAAAAARGKEAFSEKMQTDEFGLKKSQAEETARHNKAMEAAKVRKGGGVKPLTPAQELQRERFDQTLREKASKDSEGLSELSDTMDRLEGVLKKAGPSGDIPGVGRVAGQLAAKGWFTSDEGVRVRTDLQRLADIILKARSGSAVTPSEMERAQIETGTAPSATEQQVRIATATALGIMRRAQSNLKAKYPGKTWETIASEGGWTPGAPTSAAGAPTQQSGPPRISSVEEYNALPPGTPYIDPNGKPKVKR